VSASFFSEVVGEAGVAALSVFVGVDFVSATGCLVVSAGAAAVVAVSLAFVSSSALAFASSAFASSAAYLERYTGGEINESNRQLR
jgi:hypothetical protein